MAKVKIVNNSLYCNSLLNNKVKNGDVVIYEYDKLLLDLDYYKSFDERKKDNKVMVVVNSYRRYERCKRNLEGCSFLILSARKEKWKLVFTSQEKPE